MRRPKIKPIGVAKGKNKVSRGETVVKEKMAEKCPE